MAAERYQSRINILKEECQEFFELINKLRSTYKIENEDKIKLNMIEHQGRDWLILFEKQNKIIMCTRKFQEEIDIKLYSLMEELDIIKNRLYTISSKYKVYL